MKNKQQHKHTHGDSHALNARWVLNKVYFIHVGCCVNVIGESLALGDEYYSVHGKLNFCCFGFWITSATIRCDTINGKIVWCSIWIVSVHQTSSSSLVRKRNCLSAFQLSQNKSVHREHPLHNTINTCRIQTVTLFIHCIALKLLQLKIDNFRWDFLDGKTFNFVSDMKQTKTILDHFVRCREIFFICYMHCVRSWSWNCNNCWKVIPWDDETRHIKSF